MGLVEELARKLNINKKVYYFLVFSANALLLIPLVRSLKSHPSGKVVVYYIGFEFILVGLILILKSRK